MALGVHAITAGLTVLHSHHRAGGIVAHTLTADTALTAEEVRGHAKYSGEVHCMERPGWQKIMDGKLGMSLSRAETSQL